MKTFNDVKFRISTFPDSPGIIGQLQLNETYIIKVEMTSTTPGGTYGNWCVSLLENNKKVKEYQNLTNSEMLTTIVNIQTNLKLV